MTNKLERGLIVSCQALPHEPLYGSDTMAKMALAAYLGGAIAIRSNTVQDIEAIYEKIEGKLPIIGLIKQDYTDSPVYITPTLNEVKDLINSHCSVIALDATLRNRPKGEKLDDLVHYIRNNSNKPIMADIATLDDAINAERLGFDYISTTLRSYTEETTGFVIPDLEFCRQLLNTITNATIVAEGGIHSYKALDDVLSTGISHVVIGGAITRPLGITQTFVEVFENNQEFNKNK